MGMSESKVMKRNYVISKIRRVSSMLDTREYWNFVAGAVVITLSVIGVLCYLFAAASFPLGRVLFEPIIFA